MKPISQYTLPELLEIRKILEDEQLRDEVYQEIKRKNKYALELDKYKSNRLPEFYEDYRIDVKRLMDGLKHVDLSNMFWCASTDAGNNCGKDIRVTKDSKLKQISPYGPGDIKILDDFFEENPEYIYNYEGIYNTLNYLKTYISTMLHCGKNIETKEALFLDLAEKKSIVTTNFSKIAEQLLQLRMAVPNSRLSVGNQGLIKNAKKYGQNITISQSWMISTIALGSTLEKLKEENYEEASRLLFVPQCKVLKNRSSRLL